MPMKLNEKPFLSRRGDGYSDELYHHGILGQKWGVRRFQNPDGSLTEEGRRRYGNRLSVTNNPSNKGLIRKLVTGDHPFGSKRLGDRSEETYKKQIAYAKEKGRDTEKLEKLYRAQRKANIDRDVYLSKMSTGKLFAQSLLLGDLGAHTYRSMVNADVNKGAAFASTFVSQFVPFGYVGVAAANSLANKKKYGEAVWSDIN